MMSPYSLTIEYRRVEGERAVFALPDGQQLFWPLSHVPEHYTPGERYTIGFEATEKPLKDQSEPEDVRTDIVTPSDADRQLAIALLEELFQQRS